MNFLNAYSLWGCVPKLLWAAVTAEVWGEGDFSQPLPRYVLKFVKELANYFTCSHFSLLLKIFLLPSLAVLSLADVCAAHIFCAGIKILRAH